MKIRDYRLSDYRLAAYVVVAAAIAGGVAFGLDRAFAPSEKVQANGAPPAAVAAASGAVRQIPIARSNAADKSADLGDPEGKLTPIYPTSPGKDLPIKDTPVIQATKPAGAATTGSASATVPAAAPAPVAVANATPVAPASQANACNVAACAAAYRSFRESDCSYQPFEGPRKICEAEPGSDAQNSSGQNSSGQAATPPHAQPQQQARPQFDPRTAPPIQRDRYEEALRDAERTVRRLPPPGTFADEDPRGVIVMESPEQRYDLRRNWVSEPQD